MLDDRRATPLPAAIDAIVSVTDRSRAVRGGDRDAVLEGARRCKR